MEEISPQAEIKNEYEVPWWKRLLWKIPGPIAIPLSVIITFLSMMMLVLFSPIYLLMLAVLHVRIWFWQYKTKYKMIFYYNDNEVWKHVIEKEYVPLFDNSCHVVNMSHLESYGKHSMESACYYFFCKPQYGPKHLRKFYPVCVLIKPFKPVNTILFDMFCWKNTEDAMYKRQYKKEKMLKALYLMNVKLQSGQTE